MTTPHAIYDRARVVLMEANSLLLKHDPASAAGRIGMFPDLVELLDDMTTREWGRIGAAQELRDAVAELRTVTFKVQRAREPMAHEAGLTQEFGAAIRKVNAALDHLDAAVPPIDRRKG